MANGKILKANTSDDVTDKMDEIQSIIEAGEGATRANRALEQLHRVRRGYLDQKNELRRLKFSTPGPTV